MDESEMKRRVTRTLESRKPSFGALIEGDGAKPPPAATEEIREWQSWATPTPAELSRMDIYGDELEETP